MTTELNKLYWITGTQDYFAVISTYHGVPDKIAIQRPGQMPVAVQWNNSIVYHEMTQDEHEEWKKKHLKHTI